MVKELINEQAGIINNALETIGNVSSEAIKGRVAVITVREREITERDRIDAEVKKTEILIEGEKYESPTRNVNYTISSLEITTFED